MAITRLCRLLLIYLIAVTSVACNGEELDSAEPPAPDTTAHEADPDEPGLSGLIDDMIDGGLHPPRERAYPAVIDRLPQPERIETEPRENPHVPDQIDTLRTYHYDGLEYELYDVADSERIMVQELVITNPRYQTEEGLHVGMTRAGVEDIKGAPDEQDNDRYQYHIDTLPDEPVEGPPNYLFVDFDNDQVTQLRWSFYID